MASLQTCFSPLLNNFFHNLTTFTANQGNSTPDQRKIIADEAKNIPCREKVIPDEAKIIPHHEKVIHDQEKIIADQEKIVPDQEKIIADHKEIIPDQCVDIFAGGLSQLPKVNELSADIADGSSGLK